MPQTPFDITCYLDVDGFVLNNQIEEVFDLIGDADVIMSENRPYNAKVVYFTHDDQVGPGIPGAEITHFKKEDIELYKQGKAHKFRWHCGMFVWRKNERTQKLWEQWLYWYKKHTIENNTAPFPNSLRFKSAVFSQLRGFQFTKFSILIKLFPQGWSPRSSTKSSFSDPQHLHSITFLMISNQVPSHKIIPYHDLLFV